MSQEDGTILVVGGDSFIGKSLIKKHEEHGFSVYRTSRRKKKDKNVLFLDFSQSLEEWNPPTGITTAYLCAAVTKIKECEENPSSTRKANVESILFIAEKLIKNNIFVVFLSSNTVFSGEHPNQKSNERYFPNTEYGRQKVEVEQGLLALSKNVAIVRLTKVLDSQTGLVSQWTLMLKNSESVSAFDDMYMAPISLKYTTDLLYRIGRGQHSGTYQFSGLEDISYFNFAHRLKAKYPKSSSVIRATKSCNQTIVIDAPRYTSLDMKEVVNTLAVKPQATEDVINDL